MKRAFAKFLTAIAGMTAMAGSTDAQTPAPSPAPPPAGMIKFASIWEQPGDNAALDRWYRTVHSRESILFVGPWLRRYWAYRGYDVPAEADLVGASRYRLTEMWYANATELAEANRAWYPLTPPPTTLADPRRTRIATIYVPAIPDEKYVDGWPRERPDYFRWVFFMRYPAGVAAAEGDKWFKGSFAPALAKSPGLRRFTCANSIRPAADADSWLRLCELWFDDYAAWKAAVLDAPRPAAPPWRAGFPYIPIISIFTAQTPDMDFLCDDYRAP